MRHVGQAFPTSSNREEPLIVKRYASNHARQHIQTLQASLIFITVVVSLLMMALMIPKPLAYARTGDWSTYLGNTARSGFNGAETIINTTTAPHLKVHWKLHAQAAITTQPVEANNLIYWGSWDGFEHATNPATGKDVWTTYLGTTKVKCSNIVHGVLSTATVASVIINGVMTPVVFVGGGNVKAYALNANTGSIIWQTSLGSQPDFFLYGSPLVFKGTVYIGVSSHGDCPLVQGRLVALNASTGVLEHTFNVVPNGCTGGSVWTAPTIDAATNLLYFSTGNPGSCSSVETLTPALIAVKAPDLSLVGSWQVPLKEQSTDSDFGSTPTLFQATISGVVHHLVGLLNKNGIYYAFDRANLQAGPLWKTRLASPTVNDATNNIASSAWNGLTLFAAAAHTTINGKNCAGSLRALNPANGSFLWQDCLQAAVLGAVSLVPGLAEVGGGSSITLVQGKTGKLLFSFHDTMTNADFLGPGSISNGVLYHGNDDGYLYALGP
jgi:polyvinyl alcohol dehydrogenase (cytochrome)